MKQVSIIAVLVTTFMLPASAQEPVPHAYRPPSTGDAYLPALATLMRAAQFSHIKLSYAGKLANWPLAGYELAQIQDSLTDAARLYKNIPVEKVGMIDQPLVALTLRLRPRMAHASLALLPI